MNYALIIAGGSGNRMGQDIPKQFMHVDNCPIIIHTMMAFQKHPDIQGIAVVCLAGWETVLQSYANQFCITKLKWIFPGGSNGQESIHNGIYGLKEVGCGDDDLVLVHDAVRPLLSQDIISSNIAICQKYGYAITGIKCREAILESEDGFTTNTSIPRDKLIRTQTPQTFRLGNLIAAHEEAKEKGITNSVSNNVLTFVFGRFYPINDVGNYSQAYNWDTKANSFVANTVGQIAQPVLASIQDDKNRELLVFRKMLRFTAFLSFPLMFGLTLVSREFILITIHEKWIASVPLLQILCVSGAFMPIYTLYQNLAISKGRSDVYMWCNIGQVVGLLALVLFCHQYGIQTMVIAYTVFIIAWLLVWQWMMKRVAGLRFLDVAKDILPFMLCAAATMVVTYFMTRSLQNIYLLLLVRLLVSATIYFCIMKLLKVQILEECIAFCKRGR